MTSLQKKGCTFQWIVKCQQSFKILKHLLTTTYVLKVGGPEKSFVVCMDSIKESVGGVLTKEGKVLLTNHKYWSMSNDILLITLN